jgi:Acetoacetate decarboxylase (ADC)/short chain dehydrogenase
MRLTEVRRKAFAMPLNDPAYPPGPYKFYNREFVVITYRTDLDKLRAVVPEPLEVAADTVSYEFIRMPDSTGFGDYTETGQVIPVRFKTKDGTVQEGGYVHAMYLDDNAPIVGGREIWGFPKKLASPKVAHEGDVVVCTLHYGSVLCVSATMGFKHREGVTSAAGKGARPSELHDQDHPACRLHPADLRIGALLHGGRHREGRLGRPGRDPALRACAVRCGAAASARGGFGHSLRDRSDIGSRPGRVRLSERHLNSAKKDFAMSRFDQKVAIITGAASGIGKEIALRFAAEGGPPVIADLNLDAADATAREIKAKGSDAFAVGMNVADETAVEKAVTETMAKYGRIDVLVSNAGIQIVKPIVDFPFADWKRLLAIHLDGDFLRPGPA